MSARLAALVFVVLAIALMPVSAAHAIYGPASGGFGAEIASVDNASDEQGNAGTTDAAISANGRYVVFQTRATNFFEGDGGVLGAHGVEPDAEPPGTLREGGIFRYDRETGQIQLVADGSEIQTEGLEKGKLIFRGAQNPSVSADGRYVAFSSAQQLAPQDGNQNVDVYVRDMDVPLTADRKTSGAYTLVSAKNGGEVPASYGASNPPVKGGEPGSEIWPNTSISADGRYVVFRTTTVESDLPDHAEVNTPPKQLFVRDLVAKTTTLISRDSTTVTYPSGDPAGGATGPATISADGSTVAWVSENAEAQTLFLPGESSVASIPYYLWRRWQEPAVKTRRPTGMVDVDDPECPLEEHFTPSETALGPCYGPLNNQESRLSSVASVAPGLSADGYTVAFLAGAALRPNITKPNGLDVFVTSMRPGVSRKQGTRELTLAANSGNPGSTPSIESLAFSSDGSTIAFTSSRDDFVLPEPHPVGSFRPVPTTNDLYVIHLRENTLERAVIGAEQGEPNGAVSVDPSLSEDGSAVAFVSSSTNLIVGDANQAPDAFTAVLQAPAGVAAPPGEINATQGGFSLSVTASPELGLHIKRGKGGSLLLLVETPAGGRISAQARGAIPARKGGPKPKKKAKPVILGRASATIHAEGTATLVLKLSAKYGKDLKRLGKLRAAIKILFEPTIAAETLTAESAANFVTTSASKAQRGRKAKVSP